MLHLSQLIDIECSHYWVGCLNGVCVINTDVSTSSFGGSTHGVRYHIFRMREAMSDEDYMLYLYSTIRGAYHQEILVNEARREVEA